MRQRLQVTACVLILVAGMPRGARGVLLALGATQTSSLSGAWTEESASGSRRPTWGSPFRTIHDATRFTVIGPQGFRTYTLDGIAVDTPLASASCSSTLRRTKAEVRSGQIVITESIVSRPIGGRGHAHSPCLFDDAEEPGVSLSVPARATVTLERVTVVSRKGDRLMVEVTQQGSAGPVTTTDVYRPDSQ